MKRSRNKARTFAERVLKVNHAGENGAVHIYAGQLVLARYTAPAMVAELREFRSHEEAHREIFASELRHRGVRRCRSFVLCGIGGYVLGLVTGLFGRTAIAATTVAVERVVLGHLREQLRTLGSSDAEAAAAISRIVADEQEHHDRSAIQAAEGKFWPAILSPVVALSTESVIWLGMRL
ncbi:demethoxyubiquinone hydroxylase family protein [Duganella sp. Root1480D1]|uniref:demethoxyubiquinone hydroxylase family protein n=1 Tax=Duganella sp. Root1480D1 TaxID=1736471 RepID=UPI000710C7CF|nr:demethoxyubiquinone hydroxylase family protein [Duganella sp. Root1480D1]KQZ45024.1 ubiquinone biosynthesis protein UbiB [Duganella sp. Root1480D1]